MSIDKAKAHLAKFGRADDVMEFTPAELEKIVPGSTWVDICKLPESEL